MSPHNHQARVYTRLHNEQPAILECLYLLLLGSGKTASGELCLVLDSSDKQDINVLEKAS